MSTIAPPPAAARSATSPTPRESTTAPRTVIDDFLAAQHTLTAVETFSRWQEAAPAQAKYYKSLLPTATPQAGEQYAFEVDLDRCSGCKACVTACHALNGLDDAESFRDVGMLFGGTTALPVIQHVTTACHHCLEPACAIACPVNAYEKQPATGIVKHLDDQCFGCQYCTLACPYDVPKYHAGKGIVRKCDMCSSRLAVGEAPACVQACPHEAIRIRVVSTQQVVDDCASQQFLPGAPEPQFTLPTTTYKTNRVFPRNLIPADYHTPKREHAHWSLIWMLVLTQLSVGAFVVEFWLTSQLGSVFGAASENVISLGSVPSLAALILGVIALGAATLHLGRPHLAFRAMIGLGHSWLSREILAFGIFAKLAALYATSEWWMPWLHVDTDWRAWLGLAVAVNGVAGIVCSVMIYDFTRRPFWNGAETAAKFFGTTLLLGLSTVISTLAVSDAWELRMTGESILATQGTVLWRLLALITAVKLASEMRVLWHLRDRTESMQRRSAELLVGSLRRLLAARVVIGIIGTSLLALALSEAPRIRQGERGDVRPPGASLALQSPGGRTSPRSPVTPWIVAGCLLSSLCLTAGEIAERYLFFSAVVANRMPGGLTT